MSEIKIVINPTNGRLNGVELVSSSGSAEEEKYLFDLYQLITAEIKQFAGLTCRKVQVNRLLGNLEMSQGMCVPSDTVAMEHVTIQS